MSSLTFSITGSTLPLGVPFLTISVQMLMVATNFGCAGKGGRLVDWNMKWYRIDCIEGAGVWEAFSLRKAHRAPGHFTGTLCRCVYSRGRVHVISPRTRFVSSLVFRECVGQ